MWIVRADLNPVHKKWIKLFVILCYNYDEFECYLGVDCCVYYYQGDVEEDDMVPDKESDIRPRFHKARTHSVSGAGPSAEDVRIVLVAVCLVFAIINVNL